MGRMLIFGTTKIDTAVAISVMGDYKMQLLPCPQVIKCLGVVVFTDCIFKALLMNNNEMCWVSFIKFLSAWFFVFQFIFDLMTLVDSTGYHHQCNYMHLFFSCWRRLKKLLVVTCQELSFLWVETPTRVTIALTRMATFPSSVWYD